MSNKKGLRYRAIDYRVVAQYFYLESILMKGLPCTDTAKVPFRKIENFWKPYSHIIHDDCILQSK